MSNESTRKAAALNKVAEALRAWGEFKGADSPEAREAARTALDLATRHLGIIMAASNTYGRNLPTAYLEWVQKAAAQRGRIDFGKYWCWWQELTQPHLCGSPVPVGFPDDLERWADELEKAGHVQALGNEGADVSEGGGGAATAQVSKRYKLAHESYEWACAERPDLVGEGRGRYPPDLHKHVMQNWPGYTEAKMKCPAFETWTKYVREYERLTTGPKNTRRSGRTGRNVLSQDDL